MKGRNSDSNEVVTLSQILLKLSGSVSQVAQLYTCNFIHEVSPAISQVSSPLSILLLSKVGNI